ncbi:mRNA surveillance protein pelota [Candidatus Woesearchaeota archaeon]|nr:mRNA surveillance protein pelota [Candidatus Woesearchaeota archaeon]
MKLMFSDFRKGLAKVRVTNLDDLWYLSQIIDENDTVKGETLRKIKLGSGENQDIVRKPVFLSIKVEKTEFSKESSILRVSGMILEGPEDVPRGTHHTFNVEIDSTITVEKEKWLDFQIEKLNEACSEKQSRILLVVFDREEAHFAHAKTYGYEYLSEIKSDLPRKGEETKTEGNYYDNILKQIREYESRYGIEKIVIASPAFWKEYLMKKITDPELKRKIITATCSSADKTAFDEVLKRPEVETALKESRIVEEMSLVEDLLKEIMKDGLAKYGLDEVDNAVNLGAVKTLLITDSFIRKTREDNAFERIENLLKKVESMKGKVIIISFEHDGGKKLDGLGGIAALLRYKLD